jgi:hypothetical protein
MVDLHGDRHQWGGAQQPSLSSEEFRLAGQHVLQRTWLVQTEVVSVDVAEHHASPDQRNSEQQSTPEAVQQPPRDQAVAFLRRCLHFEPADDGGGSDRSPRPWS